MSCAFHDEFNSGFATLLPTASPVALLHPGLSMI